MTSSHDVPEPDAIPADGEPADRDLPELSEAEERDVVALLADVAAATAPLTTPPAVVARLDDALAGLVADRSTEDGADGAPASPRSTVVPLTPAAGRTTGQRRRRVTGTLLAAAAVVVGGYAVGNLASDGTLTGGPFSASDAGSGSGDSAAGGGQAEGGSDGSGGRTGSGTTATRGESMSVVPTVREDRLAADVRRVVRLFGAGIAEEPEDSSAEGGGTTDETRDCPVPRLTEDQRLYEVRFRGEPSGLVVGPRQQQRVEVTLYSCSTGGVELARTLPAP